MTAGGLPHGRSPLPPHSMVLVGGEYVEFCGDHAAHSH